MIEFIVFLFTLFVMEFVKISIWQKAIIWVWYFISIVLYKVRIQKIIKK